MISVRSNVIATWDYYFPKLVKYKLSFGNCEVPSGWKTDTGLADWVEQVRKVQSGLSKTRRNQLLELGFNLNYDLYRWNFLYQEFKAFVKKHKHSQVPSNDPQYKTLYLWLQRQKKDREKLSEERLSLLNEAGMIWDIQTVNDAHWDKRFKELAAYKRRYKDCLVPRNWPKNPDLGKWVERQRSLQVKGKLRTDRKKSLDELGFLWTKKNTIQKIAFDKKWQKKYRQLIAYKDKYGHTVVPHEWPENPHLARWVNGQRMKYSNNELPQEQQAKLEEIGFVWNTKEQHWWERYYSLAAFKKQFGHIQIPKDWEENNGLNKWTYYIRRHKHILSKDKICLLDELGFDWNKKKRTKVTWMEMYEQLVRYKKKHGHTKVGRREVKGLGKWVYDQHIERTPLSEERKKLLKKIGFKFRHL